MKYVCWTPELVDSNVFWIFVLTLLLNTKSPSTVTKNGVLFCPRNYRQPAPSNVFLNGSDSVTRVNYSTRVTIFGDFDSTRVTLRKMVTRLDSSHVFHKMTRLESQSIKLFETRVRVIFAKSQSLWLTNPVCLHTKKWSFFSPVMITIGANFLFWLSSRVMLYPEGQVFITCTEVDLRFAFHWGSRRVQYRPIDTSSWSRYLHIVIKAVGHMLLLWVFSR